MEKIILRCLVLWSVMLLGTAAFAKVEESQLQEICYETLQRELSEIGIFQEATEHFLDKGYHQIRGGFSPLYRNISSFGVELDDPAFGLRTYTFGNPTGYIHPPAGPYPKSKRSDKWAEAAKQNIYAEEYIQDPQGKELFLGCAYFFLEGPSLIDITRDRYVYDGDLMSVKKSGSGHKAWYTENNSFDLQDTPFVTWKRLFIYPAGTQNSYFDRFAPFDGIPGNSVESFAEVYPTNSEGDGVNYTVYGNFGEIISTSSPALIPVKWEENEIFTFNSYYQAIEAAFPEIAPKLSIHGALPYNSFKRLLGHQEETERNAVWSIVADTRDVTKYYLQKQAGMLEKESEVFESFLEQIPLLEEKVDSIVAPYEQKAAEKEQWNLNFLNQKKSASETPENLETMTEESWETQELKPKIALWRYIMAGGAIVFILISVVLFFRRRHE